MSDKPKKPRAKKVIRTAQCLEGVAAGKTTTEIAKDLGIRRQTVSQHLNSKEADEILKAAKDRCIRMVAKSLDKIEVILDDSNPEGFATGARVALAVLKSHGVIREQVDVNHNLPKPVVIRRNGKEIILGVKSGEDDSET